MGKRIDIGELYRKRLLLNHTATEAVQARKPVIHSVSDVSEIADAVALSTARSQADKILRDAAKEARKLLRNARKKANSLEESGRRRANGLQIKAKKEGYEHGYKEGRKEAEKALEAGVLRLNTIADSIRSSIPALTEDFTKDLSSLILTVAKKITSVSFPGTADVLQQNIISILSDDFATERQISIRLSSDDYASVTQDPALVEKLNNGSLRFHCDTSLSCGECRIVSPLKAVVVSFEQRAELVKDELVRLIDEEFSS